MIKSQNTWVVQTRAIQSNPERAKQDMIKSQDILGAWTERGVQKETNRI